MKHLRGSRTGARSMGSAGSSPDRTWTSWSGLTTVTARDAVAPRDAGEVADAVRRAADRGWKVRMRGSGHSFTDVAATEGLLLDPTRLTGVVAVDRAAMTVTALAGTTLRELNGRLAGLGLALHNMGDVDAQTVAGAVSTGTHGTGGVTASLSGQLEALELVAADGTVHRVDRSRDADLFAAARVGLGAVGVLTALTFRVEPAFALEAHERPMGWDELVSRHDELVERHHHVDGYWFPHTDRCLVKVNDRTTDDIQPLPVLRGWVDDELLANTAFGVLDRLATRWPGVAPHVNAVSARALGARRYSDASARVFVSPRRVRFREMEYAVPREAGMAALSDARAAMERAGIQVAWPVEIRATPADEAWLSTAHGRASTYLAFHVGARTDHRAYFSVVEEVLRAYDGRPHWGKLHTRDAAGLATAYEHWADFARVRDRVDPDRLFGNGYLERVLG